MRTKLHRQNCHNEAQEITTQFNAINVLQSYSFFLFSMFHLWRCYPSSWPHVELFEADLEAGFEYGPSRGWHCRLTGAAPIFFSSPLHCYFNKAPKDTINLDFLRPSCSSFSFLLCTSIMPICTSNFFIVITFDYGQVCLIMQVKKSCWNSFERAVRRSIEWFSVSFFGTIFPHCLKRSRSGRLSHWYSSSRYQFSLSRLFSCELSAVLESLVLLW